MSLVQEKENRLKIRHIFNQFASGNKIPNNKVKRFFEQLGVTCDLFFYDLDYYFPQLQKGASLSFDDCLAFIDYIITPKTSNKEIIKVFKLFDKAGTGHISTTELLAFLKKEIDPWEYEKYSQILTAYGSTINYVDMFQKNKNIL